MQEMVNVWFQWVRSSRDAKWVAARGVNDDWTIRREIEEVLVHPGFPLDWQVGNTKRNAYEPYEEASGLFREVAVLEPKPEAISDFVRSYGPLTYGRLYVPVDFNGRLPRPPKAVSLGVLNGDKRKPEAIEALQCVTNWVMAGAVQGDSLSLWRETIREVKVLVTIWDAIGQRDQKALERYVRLETKKADTFSSILDDDGEVVDGPRRFTDDDLSDLTLIQAAECSLTSVLSRHINNGISLTMYPPESRKRGQLAAVPSNLYHAIWLQFVLAVNGSKKFGACEVCGRPFEISPQVARTNRKLCSNACKAKAHRRRREQALALAALGRTPKQIAKQVGSHLTTVQKWLQESKREG